MKKTQTERIIETLSDKNWHCTSEFYRDFMADPRRRMVDLKEKGYDLESRICQQHAYHDGGSKEWRIKQTPTKLKQVVEIKDGVAHITYQVT